MKLDAHVHTHYSGNTTIKYLDRIMKESYSTPEKLYRLAKSRGMDLVTITDHDSVSGVLTIADRPDVIVGCEHERTEAGQLEANVHLRVGQDAKVHGDNSRLRSLSGIEDLGNLVIPSWFVYLTMLGPGIAAPGKNMLGVKRGWGAVAFGRARG